MRKLAALSRFLCESAQIAPEKAHAFVSLGELNPRGDDFGFHYSPEGGKQRQISIGWLKYDGVLQVEDFAGDGLDFLALVCAWLADHDPDRERVGLASPEVDIDINDGITCDLELKVDFEELLTLREDPGGPIRYAGLNWRRAELDIEAAETLAGFSGKTEHA